MIFINHITFCLAIALIGCYMDEPLLFPIIASYIQNIKGVFGVVLVERDGIAERVNFFQPTFLFLSAGLICQAYRKPLSTDSSTSIVYLVPCFRISSLG